MAVSQSSHIAFRQVEHDLLVRHIRDNIQQALETVTGIDEVHIWATSSGPTDVQVARTGSCEAGTLGDAPDPTAAGPVAAAHDVAAVANNAPRALGSCEGDKAGRKNFFDDKPPSSDSPQAQGPSSAEMSHIEPNERWGTDISGLGSVGDSLPMPVLAVDLIEPICLRQSTDNSTITVHMRLQATSPACDPRQLLAFARPASIPAIRFMVVSAADGKVLCDRSCSLHTVLSRLRMRPRWHIQLQLPPCPLPRALRLLVLQPALHSGAVQDLTEHGTLAESFPLLVLPRSARNELQGLFVRMVMEWQRSASRDGPVSGHEALSTVWAEHFVELTSDLEQCFRGVVPEGLLKYLGNYGLQSCMAVAQNAAAFMYVPVLGVVGGDVANLSVRVVPAPSSSPPCTAHQQHSANPAHAAPVLAAIPALGQGPGPFASEVQVPDRIPAPAPLRAGGLHALPDPALDSDPGSGAEHSDADTASTDVPDEFTFDLPAAGEAEVEQTWRWSGSGGGAPCSSMERDTGQVVSGQVDRAGDSGPLFGAKLRALCSSVDAMMLAGSAPAAPQGDGSDAGESVCSAAQQRSAREEAYAGVEVGMEGGAQGSGPFSAADVRLNCSAPPFAGRLPNRAAAGAGTFALPSMPAAPSPGAPNRKGTDGEAAAVGYSMSCTRQPRTEPLDLQGDASQPNHACPLAGWDGITAQPSWLDNYQSGSSDGAPAATSGTALGDGGVEAFITGDDQLLRVPQSAAQRGTQPDGCRSTASGAEAGASSDHDPSAALDEPAGEAFVSSHELLLAGATRHGRSRLSSLMQSLTAERACGPGSKMAAGGNVAGDQWCLSPKQAAGVAALAEPAEPLILSPFSGMLWSSFVGFSSQREEACYLAYKHRNCMALDVAVGLFAVAYLLAMLRRVIMERSWDGNAFQLLFLLTRLAPYVVLLMRRQLFRRFREWLILGGEVTGMLLMAARWALGSRGGAVLAAPHSFHRTVTRRGLDVIILGLIKPIGQNVRVPVMALIQALALLQQTYSMSCTIGMQAALRRIAPSCAASLLLDWWLDLWWRKRFIAHRSAAAATAAAKRSAEQKLRRSEGAAQQGWTRELGLKPGMQHWSAQH